MLARLYLENLEQNVTYEPFQIQASEHVLFWSLRAGRRTERERFFSRKIRDSKKYMFASAPYQPFAASAFCAASCSASCFERPSPVAIFSRPMCATTTNRLS